MLRADRSGFATASCDDCEDGPSLLFERPVNNPRSAHAEGAGAAEEPPVTPSNDPGRPYVTITGDAHAGDGDVGPLDEIPADSACPTFQRVRDERQGAGAP